MGKLSGPAGPPRHRRSKVNSGVREERLSRMPAFPRPGSARHRQSPSEPIAAGWATPIRSAADWRSGLLWGGCSLLGPNGSALAHDAPPTTAHGRPRQVTSVTSVTAAGWRDEIRTSPPPPSSDQPFAQNRRCHGRPELARAPPMRPPPMPPGYVSLLLTALSSRSMFVSSFLFLSFSSSALGTWNRAVVPCVESSLTVYTVACL